MAAKIGVVIALAGALTGCASQASTALRPVASAQHELIGQRVEFTLPSSTGGQQRLPAQGARSTLIEFWVTYCTACARSLPRMQKFAPELESEAVKVELVAVLYDDETMQSVLNKLRTWGVDKEFLLDRGGPAWRRFRIPVPGFVVLDSQGLVRWVGTVRAREADAVAAARAVADGSL